MSYDEDDIHRYSSFTTKLKKSNNPLLKQIPHFSQIDPSEALKQFRITPFTFQEISDSDSTNYSNQQWTKRKKYLTNDKSIIYDRIYSTDDDENNEDLGWIQFEKTQLKKAAKKSTNISQQQKKLNKIEERLIQQQKSTSNEQLNKNNESMSFNIDKKHLLNSINKSDRIKKLLKKNSNILINISINNNKRANNNNNSNQMFSKNNSQSNLFEIPKKKSSLLKSSYSSYSSSDTLNEKKKIKFIYGEESKSLSYYQTNNRNPNNRVKFSDIIELYDPEFNNKTLHTISEYALTKSNQQKIFTKWNQFSKNLTNKSNESMIEFCYEEPVIYNQQSNTFLTNESSMLPKRLEKGAEFELRPTKVTKTKLENFGSDFIYYYDCFSNKSFQNNNTEEDDDLLDLESIDSAAATPKKQLQKPNVNYENQLNEKNSNLVLQQIQEQEEETHLLNNNENKITQINEKSIMNLISKQPQPIKTRGIVQVKSNSFLSDLKNKINENHNDNNKLDEIELSIKISPEPRLDESITSESEKEYSAKINENLSILENKQSVNDDLNKKQVLLLNTRRSSKSGDKSNENELNSIFKQIYDRKRSLITSNNVQPPPVFTRRFSNSGFKNTNTSL